MKLKEERSRVDASPWMIINQLKETQKVQERAIRATNHIGLPDDIHPRLLQVRNSCESHQVFISLTMLFASVG